MGLPIRISSVSCATTRELKTLLFSWLVHLPFVELQASPGPVDEKQRREACLPLTRYGGQTMNIPSPAASEQQMKSTALESFRVVAKVVVQMN